MKKQKVFGALITLSVVLIVVFSGPAHAISLGIASLSSTSLEPSQTLSFQAIIDLHEHDFLRTDVIFTVVINSTQDSYNCSFDINSNLLSDCSSFTVSLNSSALFSAITGYGHLTGYSSGVFQTINFSAEQAQGYGFVPGSGEDQFFSGITSTAELIYDLTWTTQSVNTQTQYTISLYAELSDTQTNTIFETYTDNIATFSVNPTTTQGTPSGGSRSSGSTGGLAPPSTPILPTPEPQQVLSQEEHTHLHKQQQLRTILNNTPMNTSSILMFTFGPQTGSTAGKQHTLEIKDIHYTVNKQSALIEIRSVPQLIEIQHGQTIIVDTDKNGIYDLIIQASILSAETVSITLQELFETAGQHISQGQSIMSITQEEQTSTEPTPPPTTTENTPPDTTIQEEQTPTHQTNKTSISAFFWALLAITILCAGAVMFIYYRHRWRFEY